VAQGTVWIEPQDGVQLDRNGKPVTGAAAATNGTGTFQFPTAFGGLNDNEITRQKAELDRVAKNQQSIEETELPVYTLPENSTLVGSQAMTALLGRVPIDGKVTDPYPFKVLIGKENLTANGIELPDVEGAIVSGTATGDWVLSCVRGDVHSITFVFNDGTVRTVPQSAKSSDGSNGKSNGGSIGWLSDEHGIPCLSGDRKTNATTYLLRCSHSLPLVRPLMPCPKARPQQPLTGRPPVRLPVAPDRLRWARRYQAVRMSWPTG
jgi:cell division protein ZapB